MVEKKLIKIIMVENYMFPINFVFFFWVNLMTLPVEIVFQTYFMPPKLHSLAFLISE